MAISAAQRNKIKEIFEKFIRNRIHAIDKDNEAILAYKGNRKTTGKSQAKYEIKKYNNTVCGMDGDARCKRFI